MVANPSKFQLISLSKNKNIEEKKRLLMEKPSDTVELLGITLDKNINFKRHIQNICHKYSSNFRYCPLIWIFCGKNE